MKNLKITLKEHIKDFGLLYVIIPITIVTPFVLIYGIAYLMDMQRAADLILK